MTRRIRETWLSFAPVNKMQKSAHGSCVVHGVNDVDFCEFNNSWKEEKGGEPWGKFSSVEKKM